MTFHDFARAHGLIIRDLISHRWVSTPTEDHPRKRNGRYKYLGNVGWVQNWATMESPTMWKDSTAAPVDYRKVFAESEKKREQDAKKAADKAAWILGKVEKKPHAYLAAKGFPELQANVWTVDGKNLLVLPMRIGGNLAGVQLITEDGEKKFLYGQRTQGASLTMDAKGIPIFCEGMATALSVRQAMRLVKVRYRIECCFSAGNLKTISGRFPDGLIVADNDKSETGLRCARDTGKPYWISSAVGDDFNDYHIREGIRAAADSLYPIVLDAISRASSAEISPQSAAPVRA
jgi:putative DNA primase/helicase